MKNISQLFFKSLAKINKILLPSLAQKDLRKLAPWQKGLIGYRYWITKNSLSESGWLDDFKKSP